MRPESIKQFTYMYGASVALGLLGLFAALGKTSFTFTYATHFGDSVLSSFILTGAAGASIWVGLAMILLVPLLLWYFVAGRGSQTARWIAAVRAAVGGLRLLYLLYVLGWLVLSHMPVESWVWYAMMFGVIGEALHAGGVYFLFAPDAQEWFASGGPTAARPEEVFG